MISNRYKNYKKDQMGQLFVTAQRYGYNPFEFVPTFMNSNTENILREDFSVYDGMGYTYLIADAIGKTVTRQPAPAQPVNDDILFWAGYIYRTWTFMTGESSKDIYNQAPLLVVLESYPYHVMSPEMAVDRIRGI